MLNHQATVRETDPQAVVRDFTPMIQRLAHSLLHRLPQRVLVDDLVGAAFVALAELCTRHPDMPLAEFERLALPRLRGAMLDEIRANDPLSRRMRHRVKAIARAQQRTSMALGRRPSDQEVAAAASLSMQAYTAALSVAHQSANTVNLDQGEVEVTDVRERGPEEHVVWTHRLERLHRALAALPERHRRILELYYGEDMTLRQIGGMLGVTEARISQLVSESVQRLRTGCVSMPPPR
ncbi:MAG: sigma-70 family RNA polymerase sigma factor [Polyangiaceae bacterium]